MVINMKAYKIVKVLLFIFVITLLIPSLIACNGEAPGSGNNNPVVTPDITPRPSPSQSTPSPSPKPTESIDVPATPKPDSPYFTALDICTEWFNGRKTLHPFTVHEFYYDSDPPPTTFSLRDEDFYEFFVSYHINNGHEQTKRVLVHEDSGELLSFFISDDEYTIVLRSLDDWYNGDDVVFLPPRLTAANVMSIYNTWLDDLPDEVAHLSEIQIQWGSFGEFMILGEQYYLFHAVEDYIYWYNILAHMVTGELLFFAIHDGQFGGFEIMEMDEFLKVWFGIDA